MSLFNLDRFRYEKTAASKDKECGSKSPESEKENKPGKDVHVSRKSRVCWLDRTLNCTLCCVVARM